MSDFWPVNSPHKGPVTRIIFLFDDVIMELYMHVPSTDVRSWATKNMRRVGNKRSFSTRLFRHIWREWMVHSGQPHPSAVWVSSQDKSLWLAIIMIHRFIQCLMSPDLKVTSLSIARKRIPTTFNREKNNSWGLVCSKQVSRAGTCNYTQYLSGVITCSSYLLLTPKSSISTHINVFRQFNNNYMPISSRWNRTWIFKYYFFLAIHQYQGS